MNYFFIKCINFKNNVLKKKNIYKILLQNIISFKLKNNLNKKQKKKF